MNTITLEKIKNLQLPSRFEGKLTQDIQYLINYNIPTLESIILFGSCARGTIRVTSDIDLLVITQDPITRMIRGDIASTLEEELDAVHTDVIFYTKDQLENSSRLFTTQIKKDGILIYQNT